MLVIRDSRAALRRVAAALALIVLSLFIPAASLPPTPATAPSAATASPGTTPLPLDELGPHTQPVDLSAFAQVRYVAAPADARSTASGGRSAPWDSLAAALDRITDASPGNTYALLVAGGVYPAQGLQLKPYIELYGGFNPRDWTRDLARHPSILDARQAGPAVRGADHARLDGFVLHSGCAAEPGGAIACRDASPWISNNIFTANRTRLTSPTLARPGAELGLPGGAIACLGRDARPLIENNIFANNVTEDGDGGAIACLQGATVTIRFNVFTGNIAGLSPRAPANTSCGGAIACESGAAALIDGNLIVNNLTRDKSDGGGLFLGNTRPLRILRNVFAGNQAAGSGGAIMTDAPRDFIFSANLIAGNTAADAGGGVCFAPGCEGIFENGLVCENKALDGGGIAADGATLRLAHSTVCRNQGEYGGGLLCVNSGVVPQSVDLANSIFGFNTPYSDIWADDQATSLTVRFCDAGEAWDGPGNLARDPRLAADGVAGQVATMEFNPQTHQTRLVLVALQSVRALALPGRLIHVGAKSSVIASQRLVPELGRLEVQVWGDMQGGGLNRPPIAFTILPTYRLLPDSPCIGAGRGLGLLRDLYGNPRGAKGLAPEAVDLGAVQYLAPAAPRINPLIPELPPTEF